jgi:hypothetical protein
MTLAVSSDDEETRQQRGERLIASWFSVVTRRTPILTENDDGVVRWARKARPSLRRSVDIHDGSQPSLSSLSNESRHRSDEDVLKDTGAEMTATM